MPRKVQRTNIVNIRLTDTEKLDWDLKAHVTGLNISQLVRSAMTKTRITHEKDRAIEIERIRQIARIGNNLNQIARWVNTYKSAAEAIEVISYLREIKFELNSINSLDSHEGQKPPC